MKLSKSSSLVGIAAALALAAGTASATPIYPVFTFTPGAGEAGTLGAFQANDIGGQYFETFTATSATNFTVSLVFEAGQFKLADTVSPVNYNANQTGLGSNYGLYALFQASGTYVNTPNGPQFTITPGGSLSLYLDKNINSGPFTQPADATTLYTATGPTADDVLLATGTAVDGTGLPGSAPNLSGSFGQTTTFNLTPAGAAIFTAPVPFYSFSLQSGQFQSNPIVAGATTRLTGTLDAIFVEVPEPGSIALVGAALAAVGLATRRSRQQKAA